MIIIAALWVMVTMIPIMLGLLTLGSGEAVSANNLLLHAQSRALCESGLELALLNLREGNTGLATATLTTSDGTAIGMFTATVTMRGPREARVAGMGQTSGIRPAYSTCSITYVRSGDDDDSSAPWVMKPGTYRGQ